MAEEIFTAAIGEAYSRRLDERRKLRAIESGLYRINIETRDGIEVHVA